MTQERNVPGQQGTSVPERDDGPARPVLDHAAVTPKDLKVRIGEQRLLVEWNDGTHSEYSLDELRRRCPCASCRTEREEKNANPLKILKFDPTDVRVESADLVGNYAIKFRWSDGHDTGIFEFRALRALSDSTT